MIHRAQMIFFFIDALRPDVVPDWGEAQRELLDQLDLWNYTCMKLIKDLYHLGSGVICLLGLESSIGKSSLTKKLQSMHSVSQRH